MAYLSRLGISGARDRLAQKDCQHCLALVLLQCPLSLDLELLFTLPSFGVFISKKLVIF